MNSSPLQITSVNTLEQLIHLLKQLEEDTYQQHIPILSGSSIGKHIRHILEFYLCLFKGLRMGMIDYDSRERELKIEQERGYAILTTEHIIEHILELQTDQPLNLKAMYTTEQCAVVPTTLYRELIYNLEHCIHHQAIIRIGIGQILPGCHLPQTFGVAPSTIRYQQQSLCV